MACSWALRRFLVLLVNDLLHHKADAGKVADWPRPSPTRLASTTVSDQTCTHPTRCSAANTTHMAAVQMAVPQSDPFQLLFGFRLKFHKKALHYWWELKPTR